MRTAAVWNRPRFGAGDETPSLHSFSLCFLTSTQSLSRPSVKCGNSVSKLCSDPIPSVKLGPGSKWAGSRQRGFVWEEGVVVVWSEGGSAHWCRAACAGTLPVLRGRVGGGSRPGCRPRDLWFLLAGPNPPSVCLCGGEAVAQLPWASAQSFEDKMVIESLSVRR